MNKKTGPYDNGTGTGVKSLTVIKNEEKKRTCGEIFDEKPHKKTRILLL